MTTMVDAVIALTLLEALALAALHRSTGRGPAPRDVALNLVAGLCLMFALAGALRGAGAGWLALCLAGAGAAHASDLLRRSRKMPDAGAARGVVQEEGLR